MSLHSPITAPSRLAVLARANLLDTPPEARFDRMARLAAFAFQTPMSVISLVDAERTFFKAQVGLDTCQSSNDVSFCAGVVADGAPLIVMNAAADPRWSQNALVTADPHLRFYAGRPLRAPSGTILGAIAVIDTEPRFRWGEAEEAALYDLACVVEEMIGSSLALSETAA